MQDEMIVALYWKRDEKAISETERKYGRYLSKIAYNILSDWEDSRETVNDTYLKAWNSMPTHKPGVLSTYLGKITRQLLMRSAHATGINGSTRNMQPLFPSWRIVFPAAKPRSRA